MQVHPVFGQQQRITLFSLLSVVCYSGEEVSSSQDSSDPGKWGLEDSVTDSVWHGQV